ncbi:uncharacterized protein EV420DRAFT_1479482 [Desarmillaria tabescens]|uniref:Uncharacterized protein n=1 Tax=Armillaria tabescens TaxID=1929756 RepID=A0AA39KF40_ARMTA|nr:uncharacterized protein EV420DRAFT_1479482 [Desarmillaria tabescens]KAK0458805.1 hypothetical protein EV420DRAFT_1479482 [Desarmillaria tabescens]
MKLFYLSPSHIGGAFSTCKWNGTVQFTNPGSKPTFPRTCTVNVGSVIILMFGILAGLLVLLIIGLHFRQRETIRRRDMTLNKDEEQEQLLPYITVSAPDSDDRFDPDLDATSPLPLPPTPPKDNADGKSPADALGYGRINDLEPPPPYVKE